MSKGSNKGSRAKRDKAGKAPSSPSQPSSPEVPRRWLFFRTEKNGRSRAKEELDRLPDEARAGLELLMQRYAAGQSRFKDVESLGDKLFELRHRHLNNHFRVIFMHWGPHCVALTAFAKNQRTTPKDDLKRAQDRARTWRDTFGDTP